MKLELPKPGIYVLAVSGGVDSMVLMDLAARLSKKDKQYKFIVAHLDHGIRADSELDRINVQKEARKYGLPYIFNRVELGPGASEAAAREARYAFLDQVVKASAADGVVTAHHEDDLIETAAINILRGTGRKGITSLINNKKVLRPLISYTKQQLINYALVHKLKWREDETNSDERYLRNYLRNNITPKLDSKSRASLIKLIKDTSKTNQALDDLLGRVFRLEGKSLERTLFNSLDHAVALEVVAQWLRNNGLKSFTKDTLERAVVNAKIGRPGQMFPVQKSVKLRIYKDRLALEGRER